MRGAEADNRPITPEVPGTAVNFVRSITQLNAQRQLITAFLYRITPAKSGPLTIPPIALRSQGSTYHTAALECMVHPLDHLTALATGIDSHSILVGWFPDKTTLYQGEQCPVTLKLYIPQQLPVATNGWGLPDPVKDNCLAWRFSLPHTNETSQVTIDGTSYRSSTFDTTLSGIQLGKATYGPAPIRIIIRQAVIDPLRGSRLANTPIELKLPSISFNILELPDNAPEHFNGAIGQFSVQAYCEQTALVEDEPTEVFLRIRGRGNLESLQAPVLSEQTWKIIDSAKITRGEERRQIEGEVIFKQLLRPQRSNQQKLPTTIPAYSLSYFDPEDQSYHSLRTAPIQVQITPSSTKANTITPSAEKIGTSPEEMQNIIGFIDRPKITRQSLNITRYWQLIPTLLAALLISIPLHKKIKASRVKHPDTLRKEQDLASLSQISDQSEFYRQAGRFIERWLPSRNHSPALLPHSAELNKILNQRDNTCFQAQDTETPPIEPKDRNAILALLKICSKLCLALLLASIHLAQTSSASEKAARDAWKIGQYQQAIDFYQQEYPDPTNTPADILFNIGNCHHRLNQPGPAALTWRQALATTPQHQQTRQNLRYLELKQGAIVPSYKIWQKRLTVTSPATYQFIFKLSVWLFLLALLSLPIIKRRWVTPCICLLIITPVTATLGGIAKHYYPDDHRFAPTDQQAVIISETNLYREAHRQEKSPRSLPTTSLVKIEAVRGPWTYVTLPDDSSGWISGTAAAKITP